MTAPSDIAPYSDNDVRRVLERLTENFEFIDAVGQFRLKYWYRLFKPFLRGRIQNTLKTKIKTIHSIKDFQIALEPTMTRVLQKTTEAFTVSGLENLNPNEAYLFLSNHRDIAMDPAFVNWALHNGGFDTARIAIGDNLVQKPFISDLMRLNKSFIVKRNVSGPREFLKTYSALSHYIRDSIHQNHSVWIAQREGRAKDGIDRTDPAILKMLAMAGKSRKEGFPQSINTLSIVPISISYEFDPCAPLKARELSITETTGSYTKCADEDVESITTGIMGWKGRVHVHFGSVIVDVPDMALNLAEYIDHKIILGQRIFDTGRLADTMLRNAEIPDGMTPDVRSRFKRLVRSTPSEYRSKLLEIYANPLRQFNLHQESINNWSDSGCRSE